LIEVLGPCSRNGFLIVKRLSPRGEHELHLVAIQLAIAVGNSHKCTVRMSCRPVVTGLLAREQLRNLGNDKRPTIDLLDVDDRSKARLHVSRHVAQVLECLARILDPDHFEVGPLVESENDHPTAGRVRKSRKSLPQAFR